MLSSFLPQWEEYRAKDGVLAGKCRFSSADDIDNDLQCPFIQNGD